MSAGKLIRYRPVNAAGRRDVGLIPRLARYPGVGNGNLFQYSSLENSIDRGAWWFTIHGVAKNLTRTDQAHTQTEYVTYKSQ